MAILKEIAEIASVSMPIGEKWTVKRCRYQQGGGKRLCIATGVHGDEKMGQLVLYTLAQRIMASPECLCGTLDLYPMLNPIGLDMGERMVPFATRLDMNRAFPGVEDGTAMENICYHVMEDMKGADFVVDIHASEQITSEMCCVRVHACNADEMLGEATALCPELLWVLPDKAAFNATLTGALSEIGVKAAMLGMDGRRLGVKKIAEKAASGILCKMKQMGMWTGEAATAPDALPCMRGEDDLSRVTCKHPGMYVPVELLGQRVKAGDTLGVIIDALHGETAETVLAPQDGLVFTQCRYADVYPGTLIASLCRKERA